MSDAGLRLSPERERDLVRLLLCGDREEWGGRAGPAVVPAAGGTWDALFCLPPEEGATRRSGGWFAEVNCVTHPERGADGRMRPVSVVDGRGRRRELLVAGVRLPSGWRGTYRFQPVPKVRLSGDLRAHWSAARRAGTVGRAAPDTVWPHGPFSPVAEFAVPDAPAGGGATAVAAPEPVVLPGIGSCPAWTVRIPRGNGTLVVLDGEQFLHSGLGGRLGSLDDPPALLVGVGSADDPERGGYLSCSVGFRDAVLAGAASRHCGGPLIVAGSSLGGAAAVWWGVTRPDTVDGVVALSASFWLRDGAGRPVWEGGDGPRVPVRLGWGTCESALRAGCARAAGELSAVGHTVSAATWVGGHDLPHWIDGVVGGFGVARAVPDDKSDEARLT